MEAGPGPQDNLPIKTPEGPAPPRVLIVDDEPLLCRLLCRCLAGRYATRTCGNGDQAIAELLADPAYDVILCDLMMPVSGPEVFAAVTARHPQLAPRFLFLSGAAFTPESRAFLARTRAPVLDKPFEVADVRRAVAAVLAKGK